ncbi:hypothetical protein IAT38_007037 [Cryptococcus sp. DSM 104549]
MPVKRESWRPTPRAPPPSAPAPAPPSQLASASTYRHPPPESDRGNGWHPPSQQYRAAPPSRGPSPPRGYDRERDWERDRERERERERAWGRDRERERDWQPQIDHRAPPAPVDRGWPRDDRYGQRAHDPHDFPPDPQKPPPHRPDERSWEAYARTRKEEEAKRLDHERRREDQRRRPDERRPSPPPNPRIDYPRRDEGPVRGAYRSREEEMRELDRADNFRRREEDWSRVAREPVQRFRQENPPPPPRAPLPVPRGRRPSPDYGGGARRPSPMYEPPPPHPMPVARGPPPPSRMRRPSPDYGAPVPPRRPSPDYGAPVPPRRPSPDYGAPVHIRRPSPDYGAPVPIRRPSPDYGAPVPPRRPSPDYAAGGRGGPIGGDRGRERRVSGLSDGRRASPDYGVGGRGEAGHRNPSPLSNDRKRAPPSPPLPQPKRLQRDISPPYPRRSPSPDYPARDRISVNSGRERRDEGYAGRMPERERSPPGMERRPLSPGPGPIPGPGPMGYRPSAPPQKNPVYTSAQRPNYGNDVPPIPFPPPPPTLSQPPLVPSVPPYPQQPPIPVFPYADAADETEEYDPSKPYQAAPKAVYPPVGYSLPPIQPPPAPVVPEEPPMSSRTVPVKISFGLPKSQKPPSPRGALKHVFGDGDSPRASSGVSDPISRASSAMEVDPPSRAPSPPPPVSATPAPTLSPTTFTLPPSAPSPPPDDPNSLEHLDVIIERIASAERAFGDGVSAVPPYVQGAFSQWWSHTQAHAQAHSHGQRGEPPALLHFLAHYFGRTPTDAEAGDVRELHALRERMADEQEAGRLYLEGLAAGAGSEKGVGVPVVEAIGHVEGVNGGAERSAAEAEGRRESIPVNGGAPAGGQTVVSRWKPSGSTVPAVPVISAGTSAVSSPQQNAESSPATVPSAGVEPASPKPASTLASDPQPGTLAVASPPQASGPPYNPSGEMFEKIATVGEGTYGKVYKARNNDTGQMVALKRIRLEGEKDGFPVTAMREIKLLQALKHENVVRLMEMVVSQGSVYMVLEYMDHDLTGLLAHPNITFSPANMKSLNHQMLSGLAYLHHRGILHRDMKGSNILLNSAGELKLADFGLARVYSKRHRDDYTNRVITLWYRSPELLLGETVYGPEVDMWSAGCIMLELSTSKPVFQGNDEIHQLEVIYSVMGTPRESDWPGVVELPWYELVKPREAVPSRFRAAFAKWLTPAALDLVEGLLFFDPAKRLSANSALKTAYFVSEEPKMEKPTQLSGMGEHHEMSAKLERRNRKRLEMEEGQRGAATVDDIV